MMLEDQVVQLDENYIYRYRSLEYNNNLESLQNNRLYFSRVIDFNDPFDGLVTVDIEKVLRDINQNILMHLPDYIQEHYEEDFLKISMMSALWNMKDKNDILMEHNNRIFDQIMTIQEKIQANTKVICFSRDIYSVPMWAHYANEHRGIAIAYSKDDVLSASVYNERGEEINTKFILKPVKYEDTRVDMTKEMHLYSNKGMQVFTYENDLIPNLDRGKVRKSLLTKSKEWEYEQEIRFLPKIIEAGEEEEQSYLTVKPRAVILGGLCKSGVENYTELINVVKENRIPLYKISIMYQPDKINNFQLVKCVI